MKSKISFMALLFFGVEHGFHEVLVGMDRIEEGLHVDLAFLARGVGIHLDAAAGGLLEVQGAGLDLRAVVEVQLLGDLLHRRVHEHRLVVQDDDRVDDVLQVAHLVRGDDEGGILGRVAGHGLAELRLGRDVQAVRGLVQIIVFRVAREREGDPRLLELAGGHRVHPLGGLDFQFREDVQEFVQVEGRPEDAVFLGEVNGLGVNGRDLVRQIELVGEEGGLAVERIAAVHENGSFLGLLQAAEKRQQGGLPHPVLAEESVDVAFGHLHGDVLQHLLGAVAESEVVDFNHIVCVY